MNTDNNITDKPTILAVDDNPSSFDQISNTFRDSASILSAVNYQNGMEIAENEQPDLILLNEKIKESDGLEVCLALQKRPETRDIPIIIMSNNSENSNEAGSINAGAVDFIFKPLDENILNDLSNDHQIIFTLEEGAEIGGFGSNVLNYYSKYKNSPRVVIKGVEDNFVTHASRNELLSELGLDEEGVLNHILTSLKKYE